MTTTLFTRCNSFLGKNMLIIVLGGLLAGAFIPIADSPALRKTVILLFAYMTFVTALGTSFKQFLGVLRKPWIPLWVLFLVHIMAPVTAWIVGILFYPNEPFIRMGYLISASIPIGVTSIIWTALVKGDLAVSLVAVTLDTFVVPIVLPLFFNLVVGQAIGLNYGQMIEELMLMVTVPSILGMLCHDWTKGKIVQFSTSVGGTTSKIGLFFVILINSAMVMPQINWDLSILKTLFVTLLIVAVGYFVGYVGSLILQKPSRELVLTMIYSVGMRNNACGLVIALTYFPPKVAIPITLSMLFQQPLASIVSSLNKRIST
jgi:predicted Na+-dependent transporter